MARSFYYLVAGFAVAATRGQVPLAVSLAEVSWFRFLALLDFDGVGHAGAESLLDQGDLAAGGRRREMRKVHRYLGTTDVINSNRQDRDAGSLVPESKVHALLRYRDGLDFRVYDHLGIGVGVESTFSRCDAT